MINGPSCTSVERLQSAKKTWFFPETWMLDVDKLMKLMANWWKYWSCMAIVSKSYNSKFRVILLSSCVGLV